MSKGKIKWFNDRKGFGFITQEDGNELFVHYTDIEARGFKVLEEGDDVEFDVEQSDKGPKAVKVSKLEG
jgi:CspA family cold shock protein